MGVMRWEIVKLIQYGSIRKRKPSQLIELQGFLLVELGGFEPPSEKPRPLVLHA